MKKNIAVLLSASVVALLLTGCGTSYTGEVKTESTDGPLIPGNGGAPSDDDDSEEGEGENDDDYAWGDDDNGGSGGTTQPPVPTGPDTDSPSGKISSVRENDRLFGTVTLRADVTDHPRNSSGVWMVEYFYNNVVVASSTSAATNFETSFDTTGLPSGKKLEMIATDHARNESVKAGFKVKIDNSVESHWKQTKKYGTSSKIKIEQKVPEGMYISGMIVRSGTVVDSLQAIRSQAYGPVKKSNYRYTPLGGDGGIKQPEQSCLTFGQDYRAVGFIGREGDLIDSIGLVCRSLSGGSYKGITPQGGTGGSIFDYGTSQLSVNGKAYRPIICKSGYMYEFEVGTALLNGIEVVQGIRFNCR